MEIDSQHKGAVAVLKPKGALTHNEADDFKNRLLESVAANLGRVVVDASAIPFIDSRGLEVFIEISEQLAQSGKALILCNTNETLREVLYLTDLMSMFEHYEDANAAVRSFL